MRRLRLAAAVLALIAFTIAAISSAIAGEWSTFALALLGGAVVLLWAKPAR
jgi:hypothetical protein